MVRGWDLKVLRSRYTNPPVANYILSTWFVMRHESQASTTIQFIHNASKYKRSLMHFSGTTKSVPSSHTSSKSCNAMLSTENYQCGLTKVKKDVKSCMSLSWRLLQTCDMCVHDLFIVSIPWNDIYGVENSEIICLNIYMYLVPKFHEREDWCSYVCTDDIL